MHLLLLCVRTWVYVIAYKLERQICTRLFPLITHRNLFGACKTEKSTCPASKMAFPKDNAFSMVYLNSPHRLVIWQLRSAIIYYLWNERQMEVSFNNKCELILFLLRPFPAWRGWHATCLGFSKCKGVGKD